MIPDVSKIPVFLITTLVLLITPGPAVLYIVTRSIDQGRKAGIVSCFAAGVGNSVQIIAAALGMSALLVSSVLMFDLVKYLGAAYLIYLGVSRLLSKEEHHQREVSEQRKLAQIFSQGVLVNVLNPKSAIFFLAFFPQFVDVSRGAVALQMLFLGSLFILMGTGVGLLYAFISGSLGHWLKGNTWFLGTQRYVTGGILISLGVFTALAGAGRK